MSVSINKILSEHSPIQGVCIIHNGFHIIMEELSCDNSHHVSCKV